MNDEAPKHSIKTYLIATIPLALFILLALIFYKQLKSDTDPNTLPSVLINKPAPDFPTEPLAGLNKDNKPVPAITKEMTQNRVVLVNIWASWCVPCRAEHPVITQIAQNYPDLLVVGINYKDKNPNALRFLGALGNPYHAVSIDPNGAASIDWGVYGIPETYILNKDGVIAYKHVGPISEKILTEKIAPVLDVELAK